ncbi:MAG: YybH family protein [Vicinamibacterales bacterium]
MRVAALVLATAVAAAPASAAAELQSGLARYEKLVLSMDHAGIAALFTDDGEVDNGGERPIQGPAAIDAFLRQFSSYKVLRYEIVATKTTINDPAAVQTGCFHQRVRLPDSHVVDVFGTFRAEWIRMPSGWRIWRMGTSTP